MRENFTYKGLSKQEAEESRVRHGENILVPPPKTPAWKLFLEKFKDPVIRILLIACLLSVVAAFYQVYSGDEGADAFLEPVGIFVAVFLATSISFLFERKANKKFDMLNQVNDEVAVKVVRDGQVHEIFLREVVVGDIVILETGNEIPADGVLLDSFSLCINESTLTGEPIVRKSHRKEDADPEATYPTDKVLRGTTVMEGHGVMHVEAVGAQTEYGKVYTGSQIENNVKTPLNLQLEKLSRFITCVSYIVAAVILIGRLALMFFSKTEYYFENWWAFGTEILKTFMLAVTVIVATVPEGLPMSVTLSLALSMKRMLESRNLVRKMHACETMGACTVICTDKTGTLTQNRMRVNETHFLILGPETYAQKSGDDPADKTIREGIAVNTTAFLDESGDMEAPQVIGNPTEGALLLWLKEQGEDYNALRNRTNLIEQLPFTTERKYMATVVESDVFLGKKMLYVKGAPEIVFAMCRSVVFDNKEELPEDWKDYIDSKLLGYQSKAMRTLGFAVADVDAFETCIEGERLKPNLPLKFIGFVAISDPVRKTVPAAIKSCLDAGIDVKIVTGDTPATTTEIARQVHLWKREYGTENRITGPEFAALSDEELERRVRNLKIISRARPADKERLVRTLQKLGEVVAVTGDGTNDAPALNVAQVGLSMGDGTSVAKQASDITILDNSFRSIVSAVMWGRSLYRNVQRFILFQLTVSLIASLVVLFGTFLEVRMPLTVTQILWVNLIMDTFAAMALASLPPTPDVMKDKPRKITDHILSKPMRWRILLSGILMFVVLFGLMQYFKYESLSDLRDFRFGVFFRDFFRIGACPSEGISDIERSIFFTVFVMLQFWNMFNAKAFLTEHSAFHNIFRAGAGFLPVLAVILVGQILIVRFGGGMFDVTRIGTVNWLIIIAATSLVLWIGELARGIRILTRRKDGKPKMS